MASIDIYPDANPESTSVDGTITVSGPSWSTVRNSTTGSSSDGGNNYGVRAGKVSITYYVNRIFQLFDTSVIGAGNNVTSASLWLKTYSTIPSAATVYAVSSSPASNIALINNDFDEVGSTSFGSISPLLNNTWYELSLNSNGIANIDVTGISKFALREDYDLNNTTPTTDRYAYFNAMEATGSVNDPYIRINYSAAGPSGVASWDTIATASVTSLDSVAWSSISSII